VRGVTAGGVKSEVVNGLSGVCTEWLWRVRAASVCAAVALQGDGGVGCTYHSLFDSLFLFFDDIADDARARVQERQQIKQRNDSTEHIHVHVQTHTHAHAHT
jgi:hypothetical protein